MAKCCNIQPGIPLKTSNAASGKRGRKNSYQAFPNIIKGIIRKNSRIANQFNQVTKPIKAKNIIEELKKNIMALGINSGRVVLDDDAIFSLKKLLADAGFQKNAVSEMVHKITDKSHGNSMKLKNFITALESLNNLKNREDAIADISVLPYLESIFKMFGMDNSTIEQILSSSKIEGKGIDITRLISELEGNGYMDKSMLGQSGNEQKISDMMAQIKITDEEEANGKISIETFVDKLEKMVAKRQGRVASDNTLAKEAKTFINQVQFDEDTNSEKVFFDKINKFKKFDPAAKILSTDSQKGLHANESFSKKPEVSINVSAGYKDLENLSKIAGKVSGTGLLENDATQQTVRRTVIKTAGANLSNSKNETQWSAWNGDSLGTNRLSSASAEKLPAGKLLPSYMLNQVSRQIVKSVENGDKEIRLQLKPPHLGRLQITIETVNNSLKVNIVTEHHATREMLMANSSELKSVLVEQGIRLEKVEVQLAFNFDQSMSNAKHEFQKSKNNKNEHFSMSGEMPGLDPASGKINASGPKGHERLLDLVA
jgi:flagellar hook-length control protein FliK